VLASGVCGSDVMGMVPHKEGAARARARDRGGDHAGRSRRGQIPKLGIRVFVSHHIPCNTCRYCLAGHHTACDTLHSTNYDPGGFSQFIRVPKLNVDRGVFLLPPELSNDDGVFIEPLACVIRAQRIVNLKPGQSVLILGGGISGPCHLLLAKALGRGHGVRDRC